MNNNEIILLKLILLVFPFMVCLLYQAYKANYEIKESKLFLDVAIISSFYLVLKFDYLKENYITFLILNIPLLIAYIKNSKFIIIFLSIILIYYAYIYFDIPVIVSVIEYISYYFIYEKILIIKKTPNMFINIFIIIKLLLLVHYLRYNNIINLSFCSLLFYIITKLLIMLFSKGEEIVNFHNYITDMENEKKVRMTLFQITHEIKNPIAVCKGYLDMFDTKNIRHNEKYVPILKEEINKVLTLLEDFLSITKIKVKKDLMDLNLLLEENYKMLQPLFKSKNINCKFNVKNDELLIYADYDRLNQILLNIIKNSVEAMDECSNKKLKINNYIEEDNIKIIIEDTGKGMSKEELNEISKPFFTTKNNGTGLGLYLCNEVIKAHNGKIIYNSKIGHGTKVTISLPYKKDVKIS